MNGIKKRSVGVAIILTLITCGVYGIYWQICLVNDTNVASHDPNAKSGGMVFLLSLITCGIYWLFWIYKAGEKIDSAKTEKGLPSTNRGIIFVILSIFMLGIVAFAILQSDLNLLAENTPLNGKSDNK